MWFKRFCKDSWCSCLHRRSVCREQQGSFQDRHRTGANRPLRFLYDLSSESLCPLSHFFLLLARSHVTAHRETRAIKQLLLSVDKPLLTQKGREGREWTIGFQSHRSFHFLSWDHFDRPPFLRVPILWNLWRLLEKANKDICFETGRAKIHLKYKRAGMRHQNLKTYQLPRSGWEWHIVFQMVTSFFSPLSVGTTARLKHHTPAMGKQFRANSEPVVSGTARYSTLALELHKRMTTVWLFDGALIKT